MIRMKRLLVVVDYQNDFVTGALGNPAAKALENGIVQKVKEYESNGGYFQITRDTHPEEYLKTREGQFLPVPHCIRGSDGWHLYGALHGYESGVHKNVMVVDKPTFGCAALPGQVLTLCGGAPDEIAVCGVVTDICVISNAILLHSHFLDASIGIFGSLCAAVTDENHQRALELLAGMGYRIL